ncbi:MAG: sugar phosphate isomerase/epimerase [Oscillospiraceae bacterium]|nr:sugar phosphate isomerase/epimerase [Oscillospiraceae bacterium]
MNIGMITCNYFMRIYNYQRSDDFNWGAMSDKWRAEFKEDDFLGLAKEIYDMGYNSLEIWEPTYSYKVYSEEQAAGLAAKLRAMGFQSFVYCIGGWSKGGIPDIEKSYLFAKALGAKVLTGCIIQSEAVEIIDELERVGEKYGMLFAIENHPLPNIESPIKVADFIKDRKFVGANLDTGIYNQQCYDTLAAAEILKDKIYHSHFKDTMKGGRGCLPIGDGDAPTAELLRKFKDWGFKYMVSVEYEYPTDPAPGLVKSINYIKGVLK